MSSRAKCPAASLWKVSGASSRVAVTVAARSPQRLPKARTRPRQTVVGAGGGSARGGATGTGTAGGGRNRTVN